MEFRFYTEGRRGCEQRQGARRGLLLSLNGNGTRPRGGGRNNGLLSVLTCKTEWGEGTGEEGLRVCRGSATMASAAAEHGEQRRGRTAALRCCCAEGCGWRHRGEAGLGARRVRRGSTAAAVCTQIFSKRSVGEMMSQIKVFMIWVRFQESIPIEPI